MQNYLIKVFCLNMIYFYTNIDKDCYKWFILPILYMHFECKIFFSGQSGKKLDKVSRDPRTGKGIIMVKYPCTYIVSCWKFITVCFTLWIYAKNDAYLMTFFSHTREELLCCQCMEKGEDEAGWSRSWPQQTILGRWTSQYCALKTTDFLLNYFLLFTCSMHWKIL